MNIDDAVAILLHDSCGNPLEISRQSNKLHLMVAQEVEQSLRKRIFGRKLCLADLYRRNVLSTSNLKRAGVGLVGDQNRDACRKVPFLDCVENCLEIRSAS